MERAAADWLVLRDQGFSPVQQAEFERWYAFSPAHAEIFAEVEETWHLFDVEKRFAPPRRLHSIVRFALPIAAALMLGYLAWWSPVQSRQDFNTVANTGLGRLQTMNLPDGSTLLLNSDSAVKVYFTPEERRVKLTRGEVHFTVAKNKSRPFIVEIGAVAVRAVGTAFDVRLRHEGIDVLVTEGKVRVDDTLHGISLLPGNSSTSTPLLISGERLMIPIQAKDVAQETACRTPTIATVAPLEIRRMLAWQQSRLDFVAAPLSEIVEEFNRYNRHKIVISDPQLAALRFGGSFRSEDPATFVGLLEKSFSIRAEERDGETILHQAP